MREPVNRDDGLIEAPQRPSFALRDAIALPEGTSPQAAVGGPIRVTVAEERQAVALAHELIGLGALDLRAVREGWEVIIECGGGDRVLVRVLNAVRTALAGDPAAAALVLLDGREYRMQGE